MRNNFIGVNYIHDMSISEKSLKGGEEADRVVIALNGHKLGNKYDQEYVLIFDAEDIIEMFNFLMSQKHGEILDEMLGEISGLDLEV